MTTSPHPLIDKVAAEGPLWAREKIAELRGTLLPEDSLLLFAVVAGSVDFRDPKALCAWLGIPAEEDRPSPSTARTWGREEWSEWAHKHGFRDEGDAAHSYQWSHPRWSTITLSISKTPGDCRSPMASATQNRRSIRELERRALHYLEMTVGSILKGVPAADGCAELLADIKADSFRPQVLLDYLTDGLNSQDPMLDAVGWIQHNKNSGHDPTVGEVRQILGRITKEFDIPAKKALSMLTNSTEEGAKLHDRLALLPISASAHPGLAEGLQELLQDTREIHRAEKAAKEEAKAQAREEEAAAAPAEQAHDLAKVQQVFDNRRSAIEEQLRAVAKAAQSAVDRARFAIDQLPSFKLPLIASGETEGLKRQLADSQAALRVANGAIQQRADERDAATAKVAPLEAELATLRAYRIEADAFLHVLIDTVASAPSLGPFQLVGALQQLQKGAEEVLQKVSKPTLSATPVAENTAA